MTIVRGIQQKPTFVQFFSKQYKYHPILAQFRHVNETMQVETEMRLLAFNRRLDHLDDTLSSDRALLWSLITSSVTINKRSDGTLVGGGPRYTRASLAKSGSRSLFNLHHSSECSVQTITDIEPVESQCHCQARSRNTIYRYLSVNITKADG